jgi:hypothetical protein
MKIIYALLISSFLLAGCTSTNDRYIASAGKSLDGTILGIVKYTKVKRSLILRRKNKPKNRAVRVYMKELPNEPGSYSVVLLEYVNLLKMAPKYIASNKLPRTSRVIGFLNQITKRITVYKAVPNGQEGTLELLKVQVSGEELVTQKHEAPSLLILDQGENKNALEGATITAAAGGEPTEIYFPKFETKESYGVQYGLANFTYNKIKLESTWRMDFLKGPYLGAYGDTKDKILDLNADDQGNYAHFIINEERTHLSQKKREKQLTNPKSAYIFGSYKVSNPQEGMFLFKPMEQDLPGQAYVEGRIGLFIDIFDARVALNQDVVELVLVDPNNPEDFLMYYEHPDNGEGEEDKSK